MDENKLNIADQTRSNYDSLVVSIRQSVIDLTSSDVLFSNKDFVHLYEHPTLYWKDAARFLSDSSYSEEEKIIAVYTVQRSELKEYRLFLSEVIDFFYAGKINENILGKAISAPINKRYIVIKNYNDAVLAKMLKDLRDSEKISDNLKERIDNIISGKSWKGVKKLL